MSRATASVVAVVVSGCHAQHVLGLDATGIDACEDALAVAGDFRVCSAGPVGAPPAAGMALDLGKDGAVIVGVRLDDGPAKPLLGGGPAGIVRLSSSGRDILSRTALGATILDLESGGPSAAIAVAGSPFGTAVLAADASAVLWTQPFLAQRVAIGADGTVAAVDAAGAVEVRDASGTRLAGFAWEPGAVIADVAVHAPTRTIVLTGHATPGPARTPLLRGHEYDGRMRWSDYGATAAQLAAASLQADTRGLRLAVGGDEALYYLGDSGGGNTVHGRDPRDVGTLLGTSGGDAFSKPYNTNQTILFVARVSAADGVIDVGRFLLARNPATDQGPGRDVVAGALAADERGRVLVGGQLDCCIPASEHRTLRGQTTTQTTKDAFVALFDGGLGSRRLWTTFGTATAGSVAAIALRGGAAAAALLVPSGSEPLTYQPAQGGAGTGQHVVVWRTP